MSTAPAIGGVGGQMTSEGRLAHHADRRSGCCRTCSDGCGRHPWQPGRPRRPHLPGRPATQHMGLLSTDGQPGTRMMRSLSTRTHRPTSILCRTSLSMVTCTTVQRLLTSFPRSARFASQSTTLGPQSRAASSFGQGKSEAARRPGSARRGICSRVRAGEVPRNHEDLAAAVIALAASRDRNPRIQPRRF